MGLKSAKKTEHLVVGVCTAGRPVMLSRCLDSLACQAVPPGMRLSVVVVDNAEQAEASPVVTAAGTGSAMPYHYVHEPRRGIPMARNRLLESAQEVNADWVAMLDDDETAEPRWLIGLMAAARSHRADVVQGPVVPSYPSPLPFWGAATDARRKGARREGEGLSYAFTNNVLLSARLIRTDGLSLRFDETMRFTGGSDSEFFYRAADAGAVMVWTNQAKVVEEIPISRLRLRWRLVRAARNSSNAATTAAKRQGRRWALQHYIAKSLRRTLLGTVAVVISPLFWLGGTDRFRRIFLWGATRLATAYGFMAAFTRWKPQPYRTTDGY